MATTEGIILAFRGLSLAFPDATQALQDLGGKDANGKPKWLTLWRRGFAEIEDPYLLAAAEDFALDRDKLYPSDNLLALLRAKAQEIQREDRGRKAREAEEARRAQEESERAQERRRLLPGGRVPADLTADDVRANRAALEQFLTGAESRGEGVPPLGGFLETRLRGRRGDFKSHPIEAGKWPRPCFCGRYLAPDFQDWALHMVEHWPERVAYEYLANGWPKGAAELFRSMGGRP